MPAPAPEVVARLVDNHRAFRAFLNARLPTPEAAEDVLQAAFVRAMEKGAAIRDEESSVAWFYRLLRNALIDHHRHGASEQRALGREALEQELPPEQDLLNAVCQCIHGLVPNLDPAQGDILQRVDLAGQSVGEAAAALGITANNARVRLHRARQALKRELERSCGTCTTHGCLDCSCGSGPGHSC